MQTQRVDTMIHPRQLFHRLSIAMQKRRTKAALMALDDAQLKDIGVSRSEIDARSNNITAARRHW